MPRRVKNNEPGMVMSALTCPACGFEQFVWRPRGRQRPPGHLKKLWCPTCQCIINHVERLAELPRVHAPDPATLALDWLLSVDRDAALAWFWKDTNELRRAVIRLAGRLAAATADQTSKGEQ